MSPEEAGELYVAQGRPPLTVESEVGEDPTAPENRPQRDAAFAAFLRNCPPSLIHARLANKDPSLLFAAILEFLRISH